MSEAATVPKLTMIDVIVSEEALARDRHTLTDTDRQTRTHTHRQTHGLGYVNLFKVLTLFKQKGVVSPLIHPRPLENKWDI